jgi:hypothetical protein
MPLFFLRSLLEIRHPERSECEAFAQSKDLADFSEILQGEAGFINGGQLAAFPSKSPATMTPTPASGHQGPSTPARQTSTGKGAHRSPPLRMTELLREAFVWVSQARLSLPGHKHCQSRLELGRSRMQLKIRCFTVG